MDQRRIARAQETPLVRGGLFSRRRLVRVLALPHGSCPALSAAGTTRAATIRSSCIDSDSAQEWPFGVLVSLLEIRRSLTSQRSSGRIRCDFVTAGHQELQFILHLHL